MNGDLITDFRSERTQRKFSEVSPAGQAVRIQRVLKSHRRSFSGGRIIKLEGEASPETYFVLDGWLALSKSMEDGRRQIIDFVLPGDVMNPASADPYRSAVQIEALSYAQVSVVPNMTWLSLKDEAPILKARETRITAAALSRMCERMLRLGKGTAEMRIAYSLIELFLRLDAIGRVDQGRLHLPLTQQQLGEFTGLSSVHVCRTMRALAHRRVITARGKINMTIEDLDGLADIANVDLASLRGAIIPAA